MKCDNRWNVRKGATDKRINVTKVVTKIYDKRRNVKTFKMWQHMKTLLLHNTKVDKRLSVTTYKI